MTRTSLAWAVAAVLTFASTAAGHDVRTATLALDVSEARTSLRYALNLTDLVGLVPDCDRDGDGLLTRAEFADATPRLARAIEQGLELEVDGRRLRGQLAGDVFPAARAVALGDPSARLGVVLDYATAPGALTVRSRVLSARSATREVVELPDGGAAVLNGPQDVVEWRAPRSPLSQVTEFVGQGVVHILIGWDHLAFLLALLLLAPTLRGVVMTVTAFTLAHSVTLALTALQLVTPPAVLVEAAIALSIAWVAFENVSGLAKGATRQRWLLTFAFGLVHGFGFGAVLLELELGDPLPSLIGFNLGVELGQLAAIGLAWPLLSALRKARPRLYDGLVVKGLSLGLIGVGLWACLDRVS